MRRLLVVLLFMAVTFGIVAAAAWGSAPAPVTATYRLSGEIVEGQASNLAELARVARLAGATSLVVVIDSPGGDAAEGLRIYRAIKTAGLPTVCRVDGLAASAAFLVLQACDRREMTAASRLATHHPFAVVPRPSLITVETAQQMAAGLTAMANTMDALIAARLGMALDTYRAKVADGETWAMNAEAAAAAHAIDGIVR